MVDTQRLGRCGLKPVEVRVLSPTHMNKKKIIIVVAGVALIVVGVWLTKSKNKPSSFTAEKATKGDLVLSVSASGEIKAEEDVSLKFQTSGLLAWVGVKENDPVKKWQAIASLDKRELEKRLKKEMNDYLNERWDFEQTQDDYKTTKEKKLITDALQRILDKAQYDLNNVVLDYEIADLTLKLATIYSPIDGVVIEIDQPYSGVNITPATAVFRIVNPDSLYFEAEIDETDVVKISELDEVKLSLDAFPSEELKAGVTNISLDSTNTSSGGTAYLAKIKIQNPPVGLRLGMNGDAQIIGKVVKEAILVPVSALVERDGKAYLWRVSDKKAVKTEVELGPAGDEYAQIVSGINEGDLIISSNISQLKEGQKVTQ